MRATAPTHTNPSSFPTHIAVVGAGQLGRYFGGAALRLGMRVVPILRSDDPEAVMQTLPAGTPILVTVGEVELPSVLTALSAARRADVILVQNELFPQIWQDAGVHDPTVCVVWFAKKKHQALRVGRASDAFGPHAGLMKALHDVIDVPCDVLDTSADRDAQLVAKFAFILAINSLGLADDVTIGGWLERAPETVDAIVSDALTLGMAILGARVDTTRARAAVLAAMDGLRGIPARGRTAQSRLTRALALAEKHGVDLPALVRVRGGQA